MKGSQYHIELNPIVEEIGNSLKSHEAPSQFFELEFKHSFLKFCKNQAEYHTLESKSEIRPIVLNNLQSHRSFKVNARCQEPFFHNATANLQNLSQKVGSKTQQKLMLYINWSDQRLYYDCVLKKWIRLQKMQLFSRQYDVISRKKLFRINLSKRKLEEDANDLAHDLFSSTNWPQDSCIRFKQSLVYYIDKLYNIECSTVYESEQEKDYMIAKKAFKQGEELADIVKGKIEEEKKRKAIKHELQLKFSSEGINFLRKCSMEEMRIFVSEAFDQLRDITKEPVEEDLQKMMAKLTIKSQGKRNEPKPEKGSKQKKVQKEEYSKDQKKEKEPRLVKQSEKENEAQTQVKVEKKNPKIKYIDKKKIEDEPIKKE